MFASQKTALPISVVIAFVGAGCEPEPQIGERTRTSPRLVDVESCDALEGALKSALTEEMATRLALNARSQTVGGSPDDAYVFNIDDEQPWTDDPFGIDAPRFIDGPGFAHRLERAPDLGPSAHVGIVGNNLARFVVEDGVPRVTASLALDGTGMAFARAGLSFVVVSRVDPFAIDDAHPLRPFRRDVVLDGELDKASGFILPFSRIDRVTLTGNAFTIDETLFVEGDVQGLTREGDRVVVITRFAATPQSLRQWPSEDEPGFIGIFNVGRAVADSLAHNERVIGEFTLDDMAPRLVRVTGDEASRVDFPCTRTLHAEDMPGRTLVTFTTLDLAAPAPVFDAPAVDALRTSHASTIATEDAIFVVENAAPVWWHWGADLPFASNVHHLGLGRAGLEPLASARVLGFLGAGHAMTTTRDRELVFTTRDRLFSFAPYDDEGALTRVHKLEAGGAVTTTSAGLHAGVPPLGLHRLFDDVVLDTGTAGDDALLFAGTDLRGGAPFRVPGKIEIVLGLDANTAYVVEMSVDQFGLPNGFTRVFEAARTDPLLPEVKLTLGTAIPSRVVEEDVARPDESDPIIAPVFSPLDLSLYAVSEASMLLPRADGFGGTSLAVIAVRRDTGLSLVETVSDRFTGESGPSLIERALIDDESLVTIGAGGIVVRALPDLAETGRFIGGRTNP